MNCKQNDISIVCKSGFNKNVHTSKIKNENTGLKLKSKEFTLIKYFPYLILSYLIFSFYYTILLLLLLKRKHNDISIANCKPNVISIAGGIG